MRTVKWLATERIIPNYGVASPQSEISLPDELASRFVEQGEAELIDVERAPKRAGKKEVSSE